MSEQRTPTPRQIRAAAKVLDGLPETLHAYRTKRGDSHSAVEDLTGIRRATLSGIENRRAYSGSGDYNPRLSTIMRLLEYLAP